MTPRISTRARWALGAGLVALLVLFGPGLLALARLSIAQHRLDRRLAQLDAEYERLARERDRLQHDPTYVEGLIRSTFHWARKGEYVILPDADPSRDR